jgi:sodium borate transporter 11
MLTSLTTNVTTNVSVGEGVVVGDVGGAGECLRENSLLFLLLMLGTVWTGITLFNFTKT